MNRLLNKLIIKKKKRKRETYKYLRLLLDILNTYFNYIAYSLISNINEIYKFTLSTFILITIFFFKRFKF